MRLRKGFELKFTGGQNVIICKPGTNTDFNSTIVLSETMAFLWKQLEAGDKNKEQLLNALLESYEISTVLALNDIDMFVKTLKQNGIIEE